MRMSEIFYKIMKAKFNNNYLTPSSCAASIRKKVDFHKKITLIQK